MSQAFALEEAPAAPPSLDLSPQQTEAVKKVHDWYHGPWSDQVFRLFGYAGTGKTTLAQHIVADLGLTGKALYAAFTGKAAYVLRTKGAAGASTVHSLIYAPVEKARKRLEELNDQLKAEEALGALANRDVVKDLKERIRREEYKLATPGFVLKDTSDLEHAPLLVLDEVSMVGTQMARDLMSFGTKILVLGDPAQLPPVDGGGYFINAAPDHLLTEIHRHAADSPVLRMATAVRESTPGDRELGVDGIDGDSGRVRYVPDDYFIGFDQVLVGTNKTRWNLIRTIRRLQGLTEPIPQQGDKIIVLANNAEANVFNGQLLSVVACNPDDESPDILHTLAVDDEGDTRFLQVWAAGFEGIDGERTAKRYGRSKVVAATFGQAITTHKSQGSQWPSVLVIDESSTFGHIARKEHQRDNSYDLNGAEDVGHLAEKRWLYTAITRAAERAVIAPKAVAA